jgi:hypothetical protein
LYSKPKVQSLKLILNFALKRWMTKKRLKNGWE